MLIGYKFSYEGECCSKDPIETLTDAYSYMNKHKGKFSEVRITDHSKDHIVAQALNGKVIYPLHLSLLEVKEMYIKPDFFDRAGFIAALHHLGIYGFREPVTGLQAKILLKDCYISLIKLSEEDME